MNWFKNMKIGKKMIIAFILVALFSGVVGYIGFTNIYKINTDSTVLYQNMTVPMSKIGHISTIFQRVRVNTRDIISANTKEDIEKYSQIIQNYRKQFGSLSDEIEKLLIGDELKEAFEKFKLSRTAYIAHLDKLIELSKQNKDAEATELLNGEMRVSADAEMAAIDNLDELIIKEAEKLNIGNNKKAFDASTQMLIFIAICIILSIGIGLLLSKIIGGQIKKVVNAAQLIADGDINVNIDINSRDEIGFLAGVFNKMSDNLNEVLTNIQIASEQVATGSKQVSDSSISLSQGAAEQASAIEELTASIEQISSQTKKNSENANQANSLAVDVKENAVRGNNQMNNMLKAMDEINDSSDKISKIIKVIDEIAFQTNILALNAAVEAARAGQHGKGFAVVAEEVRNLAARSANAAKETTDLIEGSINKVVGGTKIANDTANELNNIVDGVAKVANLVSEIAIASSEQNLGLSQINQGVMQVSQVVQTNSATSEESAAASEELFGQADMLKQQVTRFKLKKNGSVGSFNNNVKTETIKKNVNDNKSTSDSEKKLVTAAPKKISLGDNEFGKY